MAKDKKYSVIGFLAREQGLNGLIHLIGSKKYDLVCVFTHQLQPKSQDKNQGERPEFELYRSLCSINCVPLITIDSKKEAEMIKGTLNFLLNFDFIVSINWRRIIPGYQLEMPWIGSLNLHRGKLPEYKGAMPVRQAIEHGDPTVTITAHEMTEELDSGKTIAEYHHMVNYDHEVIKEENIRRVVNELGDHFGPLLIKSLDIMVKNG